MNKELLEYFQGDELAAKVWLNKYALKDSFGNVYETTPNEMHWRLANEIARIESKYPNPLSAQELFDLFYKFKYIIPQGGPMTGIGNPYQVASLSNCFVIGTGGDSYGGICRVDEEQVQLMKRRGGVGHDLSHIRPKGSPVKNSALTSTGLVPFMERYSNSTREVAQDGRRGALMLSVSVKHPDVESFIDSKMEQGKVTGANISVKITDDFMEAVKENGVYEHQYPVDSDKPSVVIDQYASVLWNKIVHNAWKSAEPGILFWDTIIRESVPDCYADQGFKTVSTNPCGEIPLCPYDSCRLLALNLYSYVVNPFRGDAYFNFELFTHHAKLAQRIMDDIIDLEIEKIDQIISKINSDPESESIKRTEIELWEKIKNMAEKGRRTGVGITAEGDMIAAMGLRYGTTEASNFSEMIHKELALSVYSSSIELARDRGSFPCYDFNKEINNPFIKRLIEADPEIEKGLRQFGRRNIACLTIAPTGTTSMMTQTTSGIEPVFLPVYKRRRKINPNDKNTKVDFVDENGDSWEEYVVFHHKFVTWMEEKGYSTTKQYTNDELDELVAQSPYYKATSNDVDWLEKVKMQGRIQKWVDHSISVTINLPEDVSEELVGKIYIAAWESGCKGCTVYRDGSRSGVLIKNEDSSTVEEIISRPDVIDCKILHFKNDKKDWIAVVGLLNGNPYEIFTGIRDIDNFPIPTSVSEGKIIRVKGPEDDHARYDLSYRDSYGFENRLGGLSRIFNKEYWNYARFVSALLRHSNTTVEEVIRIVEGLNFDNRNLNNWQSGVIRALKDYIPNGTEVKGTLCPVCKEKLIYEDGCNKCINCGYSKCL